MRRVKTWTKIALGAATVMLLGAAVWWSWPGREPVYKGKKMREYMHVFEPWPGASPFDYDGLTPETYQAFAYFGTNTVPYVRAALRTRDTWDRRTLVWVAANAPWLKIRAKAASQEHRRGLLAYHCALNLGLWGSRRAACEPEVCDLMTNDPDPNVRQAAAAVYSAIHVGYP